MIKEEVMQCIRSDYLLCLLQDIALLIGRKKLRTYRRIYYILKHMSAVGENIIINQRRYHPAHKGFRHTAIDAVHTHVVGIICAPAECQLAEVARSDNEAADLAGIIHKDLRSFTSLDIFICYIEFIRRVTDITAVKRASLFYVNFHCMNAESLHKLPSV